MERKKEQEEPQIIPRINLKGSLVGILIADNLTTPFINWLRRSAIASQPGSIASPVEPDYLRVGADPLIPGRWNCLQVFSVVSDVRAPIQAIAEKDKGKGGCGCGRGAKGVRVRLPGSSLLIS
ncbi:hypothetical protein NPIL_400501 [Nephila pilipes]|uniref:Uncharacterized protein n=1 Tax=Nephila pilipes TaxID=299642 RepID=A0A8X6TUI7_NEPPI|nr:hypothetical protein NPIL_400501 [Nephila pilipes]